MNILNIGLAFVEGVGLILSPCILPILPIMLAASLDGGKRRPLGIITGFILSFTGFALLSRQILEVLHADPGIVRNAALVLLMVFGFVMLSQKLSDKLLSATQGLANLGQNLSVHFDAQGQSGYISGVAVGALIGLIWSPCAGPIMAAAIVSILQAKDGVEAGLTVASFALGAGLPMLVIALTGRQVLNRLSFLKTHSHTVRHVLGAVIIGVAVLIYAGADVRLLAAAEPTMPKFLAEAPHAAGQLQKPLDAPYPAPELVGHGAWLNSAPLNLQSLRGKVVLIDFWTYSCINCVRTLPYITRWDATYRDKGLVIIGIHAPEFGFEKDRANVEAALEKYGIHYPVVQDNDLANWSAFKNQYWPAHYLIDPQGRVVYTHFGEGDYDVTENNIRVLLGLDAAMADKSSVSPVQSSSKTPETYLGYARADRFDLTPAVTKDETTAYHLASSLNDHHWSLNGAWEIAAQKITAQKPQAALRLNFTARKVFLVMGTTDDHPATLSVRLNGKPIDASLAGKDVNNGVVTINDHALYELVSQPSTQKGLLELTADKAGIELYAFTFGGDGQD